MVGGGRAQLVEGVFHHRGELVDVADRLEPDLVVEDLDVDRFSGYLPTARLPALDLLIRTSGEQRISNFMLWEIAYAELVFTDVLWPDFRREDLFAAIREYQGRSRRFGAIEDDD